MNGRTSRQAPRPALRDMNPSTFSDILSLLAQGSKKLEAVVFYDREGETIDYHTFIDPFETRLAAAHHVVLFESIRGRFSWLKAGEVEWVEIQASRYETLTVLIAKGLYLTVITSPGGIDNELYERLSAVTPMLRAEVGF